VATCIGVRTSSLVSVATRRGSTFLATQGARRTSGAKRDASRGVVNGSHWWMWVSMIAGTTPARVALTRTRT
jgi:hypothetical protein